MTAVHNIPPVFSADCEILILGSFPSVKSRERAFFYMHPQNRFWRVLASVYDFPFPESTEEKMSLLLKNGTALWDVVKSCEIDSSKDSSITDVVPNDISALIASSRINRIYTNGNTAHILYNKFVYDSTGIPDIRLPSTSPANAAWSIERLIRQWQQIKDRQE